MSGKDRTFLFPVEGRKVLVLGIASCSFWEITAESAASAAEFVRGMPPTKSLITQQQRRLD